MSTMNIWAKKVKAGHTLDTDKAITKYDKIYVATVMDNEDPERMGRLLVYIPEISGPMQQSSSWFMVNYGAPFAGATNPWPDIDGKKTGNKRDGQQYEDTQHSYGFWAIPPDKNAQVLVAFASGDPNRGYWFACIYNKDMNHMVPGIASGTSHQGKVDGVDQPVVEYNKDVSNPVVTRNPIRAEHRPLRDGLEEQGLSTDGLRGVSTSSARREAPSNVLGLLSPGGHQFVMDDGGPADNPTDEKFIRLRTTTGAQILLSETHGHVYLISRDGNSWVEMNNDGNIDVYSKINVNIHSEQNVNIRADEDVNIEAGGNFNLKTLTGDYKEEIAGNHHASVGKSKFTSVAVTTNMKSQTINTRSTTYNLGAEGGEIGFTGDIWSNFHGPLDGKASWAGVSDRANSAPLGPGGAVSTTDAKVGPGAESPTRPVVHTLNQNKYVTASITTRVPEKEPWLPHWVAAKGADPSKMQPEFKDVSTNINNDDDVNEDALCSVPDLAKSYSVSEKGMLMIAKKLGFSAFSNETRHIGYLHTPEYSENDVFGITEDKAWERVGILAEQAAKTVRRLETQITQQQFDALTMYVMNTGSGVFNRDIRDLVNNNSHDDVAQKLKDANYINEANLYKTCDYGTLDSRCNMLRRGLTSAEQSYSSASDAEKRQIQGSFYQMKQNPPGGDEFINEIKRNGVTQDMDYDNHPCFVFDDLGCDKNLPIGANFTLGDFIKSDTADRLGISNCPETAEILDNMIALAENIIDPIIAAGYSVSISSGYRSTELNRAVGGSSRSQHRYGQAVDLQVSGPTTATFDLATWITQNLPYDQVINEKNSRGSRWVHVSYNNLGGRGVAMTKPAGSNYESGIRFV